MSEKIELIGTFKALRRNHGGTDLVLTVDDQQALIDLAREEANK